MTEVNDPPATSEVPDCDCGYRPEGTSLGERVRDAIQHAREAHGIDVSVDQVLAQGRPQ
jgi:predicted small metal-binding protein